MGCLKPIPSLPASLLAPTRPSLSLRRWLWTDQGRLTPPDPSNTMRPHHSSKETDHERNSWRRRFQVRAQHRLGQAPRGRQVHRGSRRRRRLPGRRLRLQPQSGLPGYGLQPGRRLRSRLWQGNLRQPDPRHLRGAGGHHLLRRRRHPHHHQVHARRRASDDHRHHRPVFRDLGRRAVQPSDPRCRLQKDPATSTSQTATATSTSTSTPETANTS